MSFTLENQILKKDAEIRELKQRLQEINEKKLSPLTNNCQVGIQTSQIQPMPNTNTQTTPIHKVETIQTTNNDNQARVRFAETPTKIPIPTNDSPQLQVEQLTTAKSRLYEENTKLRKQLDFAQSQLNASTKLLEQSVARFPIFNNKMSLNDKFKLLEDEYGKLETKNYKQSVLIKKLESDLEKLKNDSKKINDRNKQLQKELDLKDIVLLKTGVQADAVVIQEDGLEENLRNLRIKVNELKISDPNQLITELLKLIIEICFGSNFQEFQDYIKIRAVDFDQLRIEIQNNYDDMLELKIFRFLDLHLEDHELNKFQYSVDDKMVNLGTQFAFEMLTGLLIGYEFAGNDSIPQFQQTIDGITKYVQIGFQ